MLTDISCQDFKSATTGVAAKAMRNELNKMVAGIEDPVARKVRMIFVSMVLSYTGSGIRCRNVTVLLAVQSVLGSAC